MTLPCCDIDLVSVAPVKLEGEEAARWVADAGPGLSRIEFIVPQADCAACMPDIEGRIGKLAGVKLVRVNLTGRRVAVTWANGAAEPQQFIDALAALGYQARPFDPRETGLAKDDKEDAALLRALAVSGFAAGNIMLLSVSVWSGATDATRDLFHWLSAMIALPTVAYAGRPFFRSAVNALRHGRTNMDVPISLGVLLASFMSLFETINRSPHAYFDASVTLLFFLLTGRYLDHLMRARARSAVAQLMTLAAEGATRVDGEGDRHYIAAKDIRPGMVLAVAAGERIAADGTILSGASDLDRSLMTGEQATEAVKAGDTVQSGVMNVTGPLLVEVTAAGNDTFLAELIRMMAAAEQGQSQYIRLADRLARFYAPAVHLLAAATLTGWLFFGFGWHAALMAAVAVLIITCPCALGLAVPAVQVVASGKLFRAGIMIKDGAALEKLAAVDTVIFDKTGTLTRGEPELVSPRMIDAGKLSVAAGLAAASLHPLSRALVKEAKHRGIVPATLEDVEERPGSGLAARWNGHQVRLGSRAWCGVPEAARDEGLLEFAFRIGKEQPMIFAFADGLRADAAETIAALKEAGLEVHMVSGDREAAARRVAEAIGIGKVMAGATPQAKLAFVEALTAAGRKVLMVGDGINDAPALAAGFTSVAPSSASDIGRTAAETVFMGESLAAVTFARTVGLSSQRLAKQNFALAIGYNVFAVPVAMLGFTSPLVAAVAMSTSSIIVIANALRLGLIRAPSFAKPREAAATIRHDNVERKAA
jgi:P-type Cu2+ transporter